jgi:translation initiation factor 1
MSAHSSNFEYVKPMAKKNRVVYSTQSGDERKKPGSRSGPQRSSPPAQQNIRVMRDKKGRKGKVVTVASGFTLAESDLKALAKTLKNLCGAGGTTKSDGNSQIIEIQGDHRDKVVAKLNALGYKAKIAGG